MRGLLKRKGLLAGLAGGVFVILIAVYLLLLSPPRRADTGLGGRADVAGAPALRNNQMEAVGRDEANRRVTRNGEEADQARNGGANYIAPPVVQTAAPVQKPKTAQARRESLPKVAGAESDQPIVISSAQPQGPVIDPNTQQMLQQALGQQADEVISSTMGGNTAMTVAEYRPPAPKAAAAGAAGQAGAAGDKKQGLDLSQYNVVLAAKPGDIFFSRLTIGFNSDDPQGLPVFATIYDARPDGTYGPLHGSRLMGAVNYSQSQAAVTFTEMVLPDGRTAPTRAMAVTLKDQRSGVAQNVNNHTFERYGALTVASLLQGLGYAGQMMIANNRAFYANDSGVYSGGGGGGVDWAQAGLASAEPLGQNLSSALSQSFSRPSTKSSPGGMEIGIVFLQPVQIPTGLKGGSVVAQAAPAPLGMTGPGGSMQVENASAISHVGAQ